MSYYVGAASGGIRTPSYVLSEMQSVDSIVRTLDTSIAHSNVDADFHTGWATFLKEWDEFWKANGPDSGASGWLSRGTTATYNKTEEFVSRATKWRDQFVAAGGKPPPLAMPDPPPGPPSQWPWIVGGVATVGLVALILVRR